MSSSSESDSNSWSLLESDPGLFSELLNDLGVKNVDVEEVWSLDDLILKSEENTCGIIFLFKWQGGRHSSMNPISSSSLSSTNNTDPVVFIKQVVHNACGTLALLHVVLNRNGVEIGETLQGLKGFIANMDGETAGSCLASHEAVRIAHNSFVRPEAFSIEDEDSRNEKSGDAFHFVAYVPKHERVYELDGLSKGPVDIGEIGSNWLITARNALQKRINDYSQFEIRFNLMIVKKSTLFTIFTEAAAILAESECLLGALLSISSENSSVEIPTFPTSEEVASMFGEKILPVPPINADTLAEASIARLLSSCPTESVRDALQVRMKRLHTRLITCGEIVTEEKERIAQYKKENERRRHQFVPLILELLRGLAERDKLKELYERGKKRACDEKERMRLQKLNAKAERAAEVKGASGL
jgi:ubiquitin carboxyl-terminal hydrolase L5